MKTGTAIEYGPCAMSWGASHAIEDRSGPMELTRAKFGPGLLI